MANVFFLPIGDVLAGFHSRKRSLLILVKKEIFHYI